MIRVLEVFGEPISNGGQEAFIMNMYESIDKNRIQFSFFTPYHCDNKFMQEKIENFGGKIFAKNKDFYTKKRKKFFVQEFKKFLENNSYDVVHIHSGSTFVLANGAKIAKKYGAKKIIVHSHASGVSKLKSQVLKIIFGNKLLKNATHYFACSDFAASYRFPNKIIKNKLYTIIKNGINIENFKYDVDIRKKYRNNLGLNNNFVLGHVGRMEHEKNHFFLLQIFEKILEFDDSAKLLLIGTGSLECEIKNKIIEKKIDDKVIILSNRNDVNKLLQAMDVFIFPSNFEGLGIVAIEAQASGIPVICSENIPQEANLTDLFVQLKLSDSLDIWVKEILKYKNNVRKDYSKKIKMAGYGAKESAKKLEEIYLNEKK